MGGLTLIARLSWELIFMGPMRVNETCLTMQTRVLISSPEKLKEDEEHQEEGEVTHTRLPPPANASTHQLLCIMMVEARKTKGMCHAHVYVSRCTGS